MKILIVSQCFYPEEFKVNDLVESLVRRGHEVTVLTGKPNYPAGIFFEGYRFWGVQEENYKGARVIRVPLIRRGRGGVIRLVFNYFSFVFFGCWYVRFHKIEADVAFCFGLSPITQMYPALTFKRKTGAKATIWIQDLWPESVAAVGAAKRGGLVWKLLSRMVSSIYKRCDTIFVQSEAFMPSVCDKVHVPEKIVYAPNWAEDLFAEVRPNGSKYKSLMPEGFVVMFAGNIGVAQDFPSIIKAAERTREYPAIKWVVVGDGRGRQAAEEQVRAKGLQDTVRFFGRFSVTEMPHFFAHADVMLVSLRDEDIFSLTIPSKVQAYMASGKPIVTMLSGVGNDIVREAGCGMTAVAGDYETLARNVIMLSREDKATLSAMGDNARKYYSAHFEKEEVISVIESTLRQL